MWKKTVSYARCSHVAMDYEHQYQHTAAWCSLPSKLSVPPAFPFYTFSTSHVLLQNKASLWNEGWASDLGKQNFLATAIEKMWNWILIIENPPSSLGTGGGGSKQTSVLSENRQSILITNLGAEHPGLSLDKLHSWVSRVWPGHSSREGHHQRAQCLVTLPLSNWVRIKTGHF